MSRIISALRLAASSAVQQSHAAPLICSCSSAATEMAATYLPSCSYPVLQSPARTGTFSALMHARGLARKASGSSAAKGPQQSPSDGMVQVVLLQAIPRLGPAGSVVKANAGWMRHKLFPEGKAVYATPENVEKHSMSVEQRAKMDDPELVTQRRLNKLLNSLNSMRVNIARRNKFLKDQPDEMIGTVTAWDIIHASERQYGVKLHESHLLMDGPITTFGTFKVPLNLRTKEDRQVELTVRVNSVRRIQHGSCYV